MSHATAAELELFVTQRLPFDRAAWLEHHCESCEACAAAVQAEAQLELALHAMAAERRCGKRADAVVVRPRAFRPRLQAFAAAVAACAALALFAAWLPGAVLQHPAAVELYADAGDLTQVKQSTPWVASDLSGGTP